MIDLKHEVQKRGFTVAHIKTDSIKIPNATPEIIQFVMNFGKRYGYTFEHEATYDRMCLVNDAVYIAKYKEPHNGEWAATGAQFAVPYVFKKLFSREKIEFEDMCETKAVSSALYLDMNEDLPDVSEYEKDFDRLNKGIQDEKSKLNNLDSGFEAELHRAIARVRELEEIISEGHDYHFVGKVGLFCPIKPGCGGGELVREGTDKYGNVKYSSATGAKDYRWLESETVKLLNKEGDIDRSYYDSLVDGAVETISKYGDFERFVADEPYGTEAIDFPPDDDPPWYTDEELEAMKDKDLPYTIDPETARILDESTITDAFKKR